MEDNIDKILSLVSLSINLKLKIPCKKKQTRNQRPKYWNLSEVKNLK